MSKPIEPCERRSPLDLALHYWWSTEDDARTLARAVLHLDRVLADIDRDGPVAESRARRARERIRKAKPWWP